MIAFLTALFTAPLTWLVLATFAAFALLETLRPGRAWPAVRGWRLKGVAGLLMTLVLSAAAPLLWDAWLAEHRLFDLTGLGHAGGAVAGFLVFQLVLYFWHRAMHRVPFLWRALHQMHHSAERIDVFGAFYFHPLDVVGFALAGSASLVGIAGVTAPAAVAASLAATFCAMFQHSNLRTPRWLGYLIQRPESHSVHHQRGVHAGNYGDIALFDLLFGTLRNPARFEGECGYYDGASRRIGAMLVGRDVSAPPAAAAPVRSSPPASRTGSGRARVTAMTR
jgi:sterol desaturase/sphingolipid hydroxylase (fatty acid hydroxylase superfamily)